MSDSWTPELRIQLGMTSPLTEGQFWMCLEDFKTFFTRVQISKMNDTHVFSSLPVVSKDSYSLWSFNIEEAGMHTFAISQVCERMFPRDSGYKYSHVRMFLVKVDTEGDKLKIVKYVKGTAEVRERDTYLECDDLEAGEYMLFVEVDW